MAGSQKALVTGATGFVGRILCARLQEAGYVLRCASRYPSFGLLNAHCEPITIGDLHSGTDWSAALQDISVVFHLAARTHVLRETTNDAFAQYRRINVDGTRALAIAAARAGVRRMVFLSSIKVNGERTSDLPFDESSRPKPEDAYGMSKWEAEQTLFQIAQQEGMDSTILRAPLVYGPGVKGNFLRLMHWVARGVPLPLASINNYRSLISVENLADAIVAAAEAPMAAGKVYLVSDNFDVSTPGLIRGIADALQVRTHLLPCPSSVLLIAAALLNKQAEIRRLTGSLRIDSSRIQREVGWQPRIQLADGLSRTAQWYHSQFPAKSMT